MQFAWYEAVAPVYQGPGMILLNLFFSYQYNDNIVTTVSMLSYYILLLR
jgi:hypothetical protein